MLPDRCSIDGKWYYFTVKTVPINELKKQLSALLREVAGGQRILITKHNRPVAVLQSADLEHVHAGKHFGRAALRAALHRPTRGRYLEVLLEDRRGDRTGR
jgi:prevent-host-death family protein